MTEEMPKRNVPVFAAKHDSIIVNDHYLGICARPSVIYGMVCDDGLFHPLKKDGSPSKIFYYPSCLRFFDNEADARKDAYAVGMEAAEYIADKLRNQVRDRFPDIAETDGRQTT